MQCEGFQRDVVTGNSSSGQINRYIISSRVPVPGGVTAPNAFGIAVTIDEIT
jgi:hypothetical protein